MSDLNERIRNLSPKQQELLQRRLREKSLDLPSALRTPPVEEAAPAVARPRPRSGKRRPMDFSIFFFSADGSVESNRRYELLLETVRFADRCGFSAVWTPERHFQDFGGLYPNPSVLSAALAMITSRLQLRAGSLVLPLHSPVRVAEDWALIDNLSGGRVALSFATGWHEHDYVIAPDAYEDRRDRMFRHIPLVRRLWAGETVEIPGVGGKMTPVRTLPRPIQPELKFWVTVNSPRTWRQAGEIGANVLTAMIGNSTDQLAHHIAAYRQARIDHGHDPRQGIVSLMLHTYIGDDLEATKEKVREPLKQYLKNFVDQFRPLRQDLVDASSLEMQSLLDFAFERYFAESSLLGTPEKCAALLDDLSAAGVDEAACLVDFGVDLASTLASLERLEVLRQSFASERESVAVGVDDDAG